MYSSGLLRTVDADDKTIIDFVWVKNKYLMYILLFINCNLIVMKKRHTYFYYYLLVVKNNQQIVAKV